MADKFPHSRELFTSGLIDSYPMRTETISMRTYEPQNKRERKRWNYHRAGANGKLLWTARGIEDCVRYIHKRHCELAEEEQRDWDPYVVALVYIKEKYGQCKGSAHFLRMGSIISFVQHYRKRLKKDKLILTDEHGVDFWEDHLAEALARLPFSKTSFDYNEVKNYVLRCRKPS